MTPLNKMVSPGEYLWPPQEPSWYTVRCFVRDGAVDERLGWNYEERITVWRADSHRNAIACAREENEAYAEPPLQALGLYQSCLVGVEEWLLDADSVGLELFSLIRRSWMEPQDYLGLFETGTEGDYEGW